jgi:hypothetical protein
MRMEFFFLEEGLEIFLESLIFLPKAEIQYLDFKKKVIEQRLSRHSESTGFLGKFFYEGLVPEGAGQSSQAEIGSQPIFPRIISKVQRWVDQYDRKICSAPFV